MSGGRNVWVSHGLLCQCVIRVGGYKIYLRSTQPSLLSTLLPVSYTLLRARWTSVCTKLRRRGRAVERHRVARWDGGSVPLAGGASVLPRSCAAAAAEQLIRSDIQSGFCGGWSGTVIRDFHMKSGGAKLIPVTQNKKSAMPT